MPLHSFEEGICTVCRHSLPIINFSSSVENQMHDIFKDYEIKLASALFNFEKHTEVQELIHNLKYRNQKKIGKTIGNWHGAMLASDANFTHIDVVLPVPIHVKKLKQRGYNQVSNYGTILAKKLNADFNETVLKKVTYTKTQSKQTRQERLANILNTIGLQETVNLKNKHILLVDDVITTGATMKACIECLKKIEGIKISIAAMAVTLLEEI